MRKIEDFQLIIWDLDGTLYYQKEFRRKIATVMLKELCFRPKRWKELFLILYYRRLRENWDPSDISDDLEIRQYEKAGERFDISAEEAQKIIIHWMHKKPLQYLREFRDERAAAMIEQLKKEGKHVVVYSDYPTEEKLKALEINVDNSFFPGHHGIGCLKPNPKGLEYIIAYYQVDKSKVIMIGDRLEKDGKAAEAAGINYKILPRKRKKREKVAPMDVAYFII